MNKQKLREAATDLSKNALELIQEILIKHDQAILEEFRATLKEKRMMHVGYIHPYGREQLCVHSEQGEKWSTPLSSMPFDGAIPCYVSKYGMSGYYIHGDKNDYDETKDILAEHDDLTRQRDQLLEALERIKETGVFVGAIAQEMMDAAIARARGRNE